MHLPLDDDVHLVQRCAEWLSHAGDSSRRRVGSAGGVVQLDRMSDGPVATSCCQVRCIGRGFFRSFRYRSPSSFRLVSVSRHELLWCQQFAHRDGLIAAGTRTARPESACEDIAVLAALHAEHARLTERALVDGVGLGDDRLGGELGLPPPRCLPAGRRAVALATRAHKCCPTERAGYRRAIVADGVHALTVTNSGRRTGRALRPAPESRAPGAFLV